MSSEQPIGLIVEDDPVWASILERLLGQNGIESRTAKSADEARAHLRKREFDVILLDLQLPGQEGLPLVDEVVKSEKLARKSIVVTAHALVANLYSQRLPIVDKTRVAEIVPLVLGIIRAGDAGESKLPPHGASTEKR